MLTHAILAVALTLCTNPEPVVKEYGEGIRGFRFYEFAQGTQTYKYAVWTPDELPDDPPLILFLHGLGETGDDGLRQTGVGIGYELIMHPQRWPAVVVLPQKPGTQDWTSPDFDLWPEHEDALLAILDRETRRHGVGEDRVALTGLSMGGHGCWVFGSRHADRFAKIAPICGFAREMVPGTVPDPEDFAAIAEALRGTPVWTFHGENDRAVPISETEAIVEALETAGHTDVRFTRYPGVGHLSWLPAYADPDLAAWLVSP